MKSKTFAGALLRYYLPPALGLALLAGRAGIARADTDIATAPLFTSSTSQVKPNLMFVLDDSGSMAWDYLPDDADYAIPARNSNGNVQYGRRAAQCNGVAYNPSLTYTLPKDASGNDLAKGSMSFLAGANPLANTYNQRATSQGTVTIASSGTLSLTVNVTGMKDAWYPTGSVVTVFNGLSTSLNYMIGMVTSWNSSTGALKLSVIASVGSGSLSNVVVGDGTPVLQTYYKYTGSNAAMSYRYPGNILDTSSDFYKECASVIGSSPGASVFTLNIVTPNSSEAQNYANWYKYYRTRMVMMQTSASQAFAVMNSDYRIGFSTISETGVTENTNFLNIRDFDSTQKSSFYTKLMAASPGGSTPLRGALSKVGRYYAKQFSGQTYDPIQYSCQKNFTILSTDGYWNNQDEVSNGGASGNYGPYQFDNTTAVGQQDGPGTLRPQYDGNVSIVTTVKKWTSVATYDSTKTTPRSSTTGSVMTKTDTTATVQHRTNWSAPGTYYAPKTNSSITRCSNTSGACLITVNVGSNHGLSTNNTVTISGASPSALNGTFTITKVDADTFTYTLPSRPGSITASGTTWASSYSASGCGANEAKQSGQPQKRTSTDTTVTKTTTYTDTTIAPTVQVTHYKGSTPYTETIITWNGVQQSDKTVAGSTTNTSTVDAATTGSAPYPAGPVTSPNQVQTVTGPTNSTTSWANDGSAVSVCVTTATDKPTGYSATTSDAATSGSSTTGPTTTGPTTNSGAPVTTTGDTTTTAGTVTTTTTTTSSGGSSNSLADVAMFYYSTPLRSTTLGNCTGALAKSVCDTTQPVVAFNEDTATWLHMSTYTLSLGNSGTLQYDPNYMTQTSGDFVNIKNGAADWPVPSSDAGAVNIDDLWHAAVNGRGRYFSASDPTSLARSLAATLSTIQGVKGSASAAATSTLQPVQGDNGVFVAQFQSQEWTGDLRAYAMDVNTGTVVTTKLGDDGKPVDQKIWSAADKLSTSTARNIYYFRPSGTSGSNAGSLQPFVYDKTKMTAAELAFFDNACDKAPALSQCAGSGTDVLASLNSGANLVSFLRGQPQPQYRTRSSLLGDIVNSSPIYVGKPMMNYTENNYAAFKSAQASRNPTIYVGANDGMLHAFNAESGKDSDGNMIATSTSGTERWAYVPRLVMANLYMLADSFYASKHQYSVDGTPAIGDIYDTTAGKWRTILVGGLNAGGRGYYALDITDPDAPVALWEFSDSTRMGLSFGNPIITKRKDGTWIVAFTSGYNNSDGNGHLFVVNAVTGALLSTIDTGAGSSSSPSGLNKLNAWVDSDTENLVKRFYAGDLLGNVWRFDIDGYQEPKNGALAIAQLKDDSGTAQPITTIPQLAEVDANGASWPVVYVGTGEYLGKTDVTTSNQQSIYAIKDTLAATGLGNARAPAAKLVKQKVSSANPRVIGDTSTPVNWATNNGWYVDLLGTAERINVDMELSFGILTAAANIPAASATDCTAAGAGTSWTYKIDIQSGMGTAAALPSMVAGFSSVQLATGKGIVITTTVDGNIATSDRDQSAQPGKVAHRTSWRELAN